MRIKYMKDMKWFLENGILLAINLYILHPLGLAAEVFKADDGEVILKIWDNREDPEGFIYSSKLEGEATDRKLKLQNFEQLVLSRWNNRFQSLGFYFQYLLPKPFITHVKYLQKAALDIVENIYHYVEISRDNEYNNPDQADVYGRIISIIANEIEFLKKLSTKNILFYNEEKLKTDV